MKSFIMHTVSQWPNLTERLITQDPTQRLVTALLSERVTEYAV